MRQVRLVDTVVLLTCTALMVRTPLIAPLSRSIGIPEWQTGLARLLGRGRLVRALGGSGHSCRTDPRRLGHVDHRGAGAGHGCDRRHHRMR